ncbi:hypothetical protein KBT16_01945 [Nostoc sp. CCCryo 231-06]|nr:hypothetical protein [Nostoc sp. CCCryo 231-06]
MTVSQVVYIKTLPVATWVHTTVELFFVENGYMVLLNKSSVYTSAKKAIAIS